jgi:hypothetical protein
VQRAFRCPGRHRVNPAGWHSRPDGLMSPFVWSISRDRSRAECSSVFADSRTRRAWTCRDRSRKTGSASHSARTATAGPGCGWPTATGPEFNR